MNKVILMGRLTRDAEIRYAQGDNSLAIARFSLAVDRRYSKNAEEQSTDFINCVAFRETAELVEKYFSKGLRVAVNGSLNIDVVDNKDNSRSYYTKVIVRNVEICQSKAESAEKKDDDFVDPGDAKPPWEDNGGSKQTKNRR